MFSTTTTKQAKSLNCEPQVFDSPSLHVCACVCVCVCMCVCICLARTVSNRYICNSLMHVWRVELPSNRAHLSSDKRSQFQMLLPATEKNKKKKKYKFVFLVLLFYFSLSISRFSLVTEHRLDEQYRGVN